MSMHLVDNAAPAELGGSSAAANYGALIDRSIEKPTFSLRFQPADQMAFVNDVLDGRKRLRTELSSNEA